MKNNHLYLLWTNADLLTSEFMVMMYSKNAMLNNWWEKITIIIWGATSKLVAENKQIQKMIEEVKKVGVEFSGCISCAVELGVVDKLTDLDIELIRWGAPITKIIKDGENLLTV